MSDRSASTTLVVLQKKIETLGELTTLIPMSTVQEIKEAISVLPETEFAELRDWLTEIDWKKWDEQIARDSESGKLDFLFDEVNEENLKEL